VQTQIFITVFTNLFLIPLVIQMWRVKKYYSSIIAASTMITSMMYHLGDSLHARLFWMNPGQWHRLDTLFTILVFQTTFSYFIACKYVRTREVMNVLSLIVAIFCQEANPWNVLFTIIPILFPGVALLIHKVYVSLSHGQNSSSRVEEEMLAREEEVVISFSSKRIMIGCGLTAIALVFFVFGLDEDHDWLRLNHGLWHLFIGLASYYLVSSKIITLISEKQQ